MNSTWGQVEMEFQKHDKMYLQVISNLYKECIGMDIDIKPFFFMLYLKARDAIVYQNG